MDTTAAVKSDRNLYHDSTYEIVSIAAYLIGVPERIFLNDHEPPKIEVYRRLDLNKNARIIRHLCLYAASHKEVKRNLAGTGVLNHAGSDSFRDSLPIFKGMRICPT